MVNEIFGLVVVAELMDWWSEVEDRAVIGCGGGFGQCSRSGLGGGRVRGPMVTGPVAGHQDKTGATRATLRTPGSCYS